MDARRAAFVREYLIDLSATQAAIRAGYSPKSAHVTGHRLLSDANVAAAIEKAQAERAQSTRVTAQMVVEGLHAIASGDGPESARVAAWGHLGKHLGMFADRQEHSGGVTIRIIRD